MTESGLHFAQPLWLWALLLIPAVLIWQRVSAPARRGAQETRYADAHLLAQLTGLATTQVKRARAPMFWWTLAWALLVLAMAGPRWDFRQMSPFQPGVDLVVLLDISRSMNVADVSPSRLHRARQEIQDLVEANPGISIGLIAFASVAHVVTPVTEDGASLVRQLPALSSDLVRLQGSRLAEAVDLAERLLTGQGDGVAHNMLLISDGDFAQDDLQARLAAVREKGIRFHVLAVGTEQGGPVPGITAQGAQPILSWVDTGRLRALADAGGGVFRLADYRDDDVGAIVQAILANASLKQNQRLQTLVWNEYFHWLLIPAVLVLLYLYRPGAGVARLGRQPESVS